MNNERFVASELHLFVPPNAVGVVFVPDPGLKPGEIRVQPLPLLGRLFRGARMSCELQDKCLVVHVALWRKELPLARPGGSWTYQPNTANPTPYPAIVTSDAVSQLVLAFGAGKYEYRLN